MLDLIRFDYYPRFEKVSSPLSQDCIRETVEIVTINQSVLINSPDEHIVSSLNVVVAFICKLTSVFRFHNCANLSRPTLQKLYHDIE